MSRIGFPAWPRGCHTDPATAPQAFDALALGTPVGADDPASSLVSTRSRCCAGPGRQPDAVHAALAEHASARAAVDALLLDGALSVRQAADLLGVTAGRVRQRLTAGSCRPSSPTGRELRGLDRVLAALPDDVRPLPERYDLDPFTRSPTRDTPPGRTSQLLVA